jgi:hypothetical protein
MNQPQPDPDDLPTRRFACLTAAAFVLLFARSMTRSHDLDEHQFVAPPALLLHQGLLPYADYPYFHMPTLIYLYAAVQAWCGWPLLTARLVSVACGTATAALLFLHGWRLLSGLPQRRRWLLAGGLPLIFLTSRLFTYTNGWGWNHDPAALCMLGAVLLHLRGLRQGRLAPFAWAGLLVGLAIGIRLSFGLAFVPLGLSVCFSRSPLTPRRRLAALGLAAAACALALGPALWALLRDTRTFLFGNFGYPLLNTRYYRQLPCGAMTPAGKLYHFAQTFLTDPGNAVLLACAAYACWRCLRSAAIRRSPLRPALVLLLGLLPWLALGALGPTPTQYQYYCMLLPFFLLLTLYAIAAEDGDPTRQARWGRLVALGVLAAVPGLARWYWPVVELARPGRWAPVQVHRVGGWVREVTPPGGQVLTLEPGVPLEAGVPVCADYAVGRFIMHIGPLVTPQERRRHALLWGERLAERLRERPPDAVLVHGRTRALAEPLLDFARRHGYEAHRCPHDDYELWRRPDPVVTAARR